jgi:hypothetical protein
MYIPTLYFFYSICVWFYFSTLVLLFTCTFYISQTYILSLFLVLLLQKQTPLKKGRDIIPDIFILQWQAAPKYSEYFTWSALPFFIFLIRFSNRMLRPFIFLIRFSDRISLLFSVYKPVLDWINRLWTWLRCQHHLQYTGSYTCMF